MEDELGALQMRDRGNRQQDMASKLLCCLKNSPPLSAALTFPKSGSIRIDKTRLGKPFVEIDGSEGPSISFSYHQTRVWGAMCELPYQCGIDVATASEFDLRFPMKRVFLPNEIDEAAQITGREDSAAALLWSSKEAVVKALGCGFHLIEPIQVCFESMCGFGGLVSGQVRVKLPRNSYLAEYPSASLRVVSFPDREKWISVAIGDMSVTG